jgi:hypothetical protein
MMPRRPHRADVHDTETCETTLWTRRKTTESTEQVRKRPCAGVPSCLTPPTALRRSPVPISPSESRTNTRSSTALRTGDFLPPVGEETAGRTPLTTAPPTRPSKRGNRSARESKVKFAAPRRFIRLARCSVSGSVRRVRPSAGLLLPLRLGAGILEFHAFSPPTAETTGLPAF